MRSVLLYLTIFGLMIVAIGCVGGLVYMVYLSQVAGVSFWTALWKGAGIALLATLMGAVVSLGAAFTEDILCERERVKEIERLKKNKGEK